MPRIARHLDIGLFTPVGGCATAFDLSYLLPQPACMIAVEERRLKGLLKSAVAEVLEEHRDLLRDAVRESFEDMALVRAIQSGEESPRTSRKKIFQRLARAA